MRCEPKFNSKVPPIPILTGFKWLTVWSRSTCSSLSYPKAPAPLTWIASDTVAKAQLHLYSKPNDLGNPVAPKIRKIMKTKLVVKTPNKSTFICPLPSPPFHPLTWHFLFSTRSPFRDRTWQRQRRKAPHKRAWHRCCLCQSASLV